MRCAFVRWFFLLLLLAGCGSSTARLRGSGPSVSDPGLFAVYYITVDRLHPQTVYVASNDAMLKSTDGGGSWRRLTPSAYGVSGGIVLDPRRSNTIYSGAYDGVYKSTDGGASWSRDGLKGKAVDDLEFAPSGAVLYASVDSCRPSYNPECVYYAGPAVFRTGDGGRKWVAAGLVAVPGVTLSFDPRRPATIYATTATPTSFKSTDGGASWHKLRTLPDGVEFVVFDPHHSQNVYAGTVDGLFESTNGGLRWRDLGLRDVNDVAIGPRAVYAATGHGLFVRSSNGHTWRLLGARGKTLDAVAISANGRVLYTGGDGGSVFRFGLG